MKSKIVSNEIVNNGYFLMEVYSPEIVAAACPGQFVMIKVTEGVDPLLRRPMSICRVDKKNGRLSFLCQVVGKGTALMNKKKKGEYLDLVGPYGSSFEIPDDLNTACLVAGGVGIAPLIFLGDEIKREGRNVAVVFFLGGKTKNDILLFEKLKSITPHISIATEDGSMGKKGLVTRGVETYLSSEEVGETKKGIFSCGPTGMLKKVSDISKAGNIYCQVSVDERMACGIGVCMGCVVPIIEKPENTVSYQCACTKGPIFDARDVVFDYKH